MPEGIFISSVLMQFLFQMCTKIQVLHVTPIRPNVGGVKSQISALG